MLMIDGQNRFPEESRKIVEIFAKYTVSHGIEPTFITKTMAYKDAWDGRYPGKVRESVLGVPEHIEGEFFLITTSPDRIPCIVSKNQRKELIKQGIDVYGVPTSFLPYKTDSSIKDNILLRVYTYYDMWTKNDSKSPLIIESKDDLKNTTFFKREEHDNSEINREDYENDNEYEEEKAIVEWERERVKDVELMIDNRSGDSVELHGIDNLEGSLLNLSYKDKKDNEENYFDFSHVNKTGFDYLRTSHIYESKNEFNIYRTLNSMNKQIRDKIRFSPYRYGSDSVPELIKDYENDHKDELKKDSFIKDISI